MNNVVFWEDAMAIYTERSLAPDLVASIKRSNKDHQEM